MGALSEVLDPTLFRLTMAVVAEMDAKATEYLKTGAWAPHRRKRSVSTFESGWPRVGRLWPGGDETDAIAFGDLFAHARGPSSPLAYSDLTSMAELRAYVEDTASIRDRVRPSSRRKNDELEERLFAFEVASLPRSIYDRAKALHDGVEAPDLYILREREWLATDLPYQLVVPLIMTDIDVEESFEIDAQRRIERLTDDDLRAMAQDYDVSGVPGVVADAAKFALVIDMPPAPNPGPGQRLFAQAELVDTSPVEEVCEALRVLTTQDTGWARIFRRPLGWAESWKDDLPEYHHLHTARRYPPRFDNYGWLKPVERITTTEIGLLPRAISALATGSDQVRLAARRLSMAQVRDAPDDSLVDACIGLEALLGQKGPEISYRIALRATALLASRADNPLEPSVVFKMARHVYARRSEIVHGGTSTKTATLRLAADEPKYSTSGVAVWLLRQVLHERLIRRDSWTVDDLDAHGLDRLAAAGHAES